MYIHLEFKHQYGTLRLAPACAQAVCFAEIAGTKTLTLRSLRFIEGLGYGIKCTHHKASGDYKAMRVLELSQMGVE
jgi:hypothetical protein